MANRYIGVDPMLTNVAVAYQNDQLIGNQIFPALPVKKQSGKHFIYDRGRFRINDTKRGSGAPSNEVTLLRTRASQLGVVPAVQCGEGGGIFGLVE